MAPASLRFSVLRTALSEKVDTGRATNRERERDRERDRESCPARQRPRELRVWGLDTPRLSGARWGTGLTTPNFFSLPTDVHLFVVVGTSTRTQQRSGEAKRHPTIQVPVWETTWGTDGSVPVPVRETDGEETATTTTTTTTQTTTTTRYCNGGCRA